MRTLVMMDYATKAKRLVQLQGMQVWPTQYQFVVVLLRIVQIRNSLWLWQSRSVYFGNLLQFLNFEAISLTNTTVSLWVLGQLLYLSQTGPVLQYCVWPQTLPFIPRRHSRHRVPPRLWYSIPLSNHHWTSFLKFLQFQIQITCDGVNESTVTIYY